MLDYEAQFFGGAIIFIIAFVVGLCLFYKGLMTAELALVYVFATMGIVGFWAWLAKD